MMRNTAVYSLRFGRPLDSSGADAMGDNDRKLPGAPLERAFLLALNWTSPTRN